MNDPERLDTDLDPFERRLSDRLRQRASAIATDSEGLQVIRARIGQRRRRRHLVIGLASVLVLVVVVAGALDLTRSPDDADVVAGGGSTMPFLGFANDTWRVATYAPGTAYVAIDSEEDSSGAAVTLLVTRVGAEDERSGAGDSDATLVVERIPERTIEHSEGPLQIGTVRQGSDSSAETVAEGPAVWWSAAPGWTATLMGDSPAAFDDAAALLAAADAVVDVDRTTWERRLSSESGSAPPNP